MLPKIDSYFMGLDVGKVTDFSALCVLARWYRKVGDEVQRQYTVTQLGQFPIGLEYVYVEEGVKQVWDKLKLLPSRTICMVDQTGVGSPVCDHLRHKGMRITGVNITGGSEVTRPNDNTYNVPKAILVTLLVSAVQTGILHLLPDLKIKDEFTKQMQNFGYQINRETGHTSYESQSSVIHDDLVIAVALALFAGEKIHKGGVATKRPDTAETYQPFKKK